MPPSILFVGYQKKHKQKLNSKGITDCIAAQNNILKINTEKQKQQMKK